jgi:hypothetical protein
MLEVLNSFFCTGFDGQIRTYIKLNVVWQNTNERANEEKIVGNNNSLPEEMIRHL